MTLIEGYLSLLEAQHDHARRSLAGLPQKALDWTTEGHKNSLAALACHIAGSERYWIGTVVGRNPEPRDRPAEFLVKGVGEEELAARIDAAEACTRRALAGLAEAQLAELRATASDETTRDVSVGWAILHVLAHTAYHAGQMSIIRKAWLDARSA